MKETLTELFDTTELAFVTRVTEKCDVYSFGIMLNELITAEHPYIETSYGPSKVNSHPTYISSVLL